MRVQDLAFEDIKIAITSDIVHKYLLTNAPDMIAVAKLARTCNKYDANLFSWTVSVAHTMVNPRVIDELSQLIVRHNGDKKLIMAEITQPVTRERWNTPKFHTEMKAVTSGYQMYGGYQLGNYNVGIAAEIFHENFTAKLERLSALVQSWLHTTTAVQEDDLIQSIFDLKIPGMNDDINGYWLLHFCRWNSFVRNKVLDLPIIESERYLDMIGVRIFRDHYKRNGKECLMRADMPELFERSRDFVAQIELSNGRPDPKMTYGDFGCLVCETHRMLDQLSKALQCDEDGARSLLHAKLSTPGGVAAWLNYKEEYTDFRVGPSIVNSARYNSGLFAQACQRQECDASLVAPPVKYARRECC